MWEQGYENDQSYHRLRGDCVTMGISTRTKKDILNGRICTWNIFMQFHHCNYGYVQINNNFTGTIDEAKQFAENYLRNLKESIVI
jgi:hypothetical protein